MPWYLYLALKQLFSTGQRLFFTIISVVSVALGVALLIVVLSVMGGFSQGIRGMIVDTQGDVQVSAGVPIEDPAALEAVVRKVPGVAATTAFAQGTVMIMYDRKPAFPAIQGVDVTTVGSVMPVSRYISPGSLNDLDDDSVILSSLLAESLGAWVGSTVEVYSPLLLENTGDQVMLPKEVTVAGIFTIGHQQLDSSTMIVTLREMQDLYGLGHAIHGLDVKITPGLDATVEASRINAALARDLPRIPGVRARSWEETDENLLYAIRLEKRIMTVILLFVVLVAAFLTMSLLLVLVLKKTREIGLLAALGASRRLIVLTFCLQGVAIGIIGTAAGFALGFTFLHFRNDLVSLITRFSGGQQALEQVYDFNELPAHTEPRDLVMIAIAAVVMSTLAGLIPAFVAGRLKPVTALRNE